MQVWTPTGITNIWKCYLQLYEACLQSNLDQGLDGAMVIFISVSSFKKWYNFLISRFLSFKKLGLNFISSKKPHFSRYYKQMLFLEMIFSFIMTQVKKLGESVKNAFQIKEKSVAALNWKCLHFASVLKMCWEYSNTLIIVILVK